MWMHVLLWWPILIGIGGISSLLVGMRGVVHARQEVLGGSPAWLSTESGERIAECLLAVGVGSVMSGLIGVSLTAYAGNHETGIVTVAVCLGGICGLLSGITNGSFREVSACVLGVFGGGIGGYIQGLPGVLLGGGVGGVLGWGVGQALDAWHDNPLGGAGMAKTVFIIGSMFTGGLLGLACGEILNIDTTISARAGFLSGGFLSGLQSVSQPLLRAFAHGLHRLMTKVSTPVIIRRHMHRVLCHHCFRYSDPLQSRYQHGQRMCEHCQHTIEHTAIEGQLIFLFGMCTVTINGTTCHITQPQFEVRHLPERVVVFINPGFNAPHRPFV